MDDKPQKNEMKNMDVNPTGSQDWATSASLAKNANAAPQDQDAHEAKAMTRRILDGYLITESDTRVTARPITDADRYAFLKTLPHYKVDRIMYAEPDSWDAIIDNAMKENTK